MVWIIAGHLFFYGPASVQNLQMVLTYAEDWYLQPLFSVAIAVDTYFVIRYAQFVHKNLVVCRRKKKSHVCILSVYFISGLVLSYLFFQTEKQKKKDSAIVKFASSVINRYLR